MKTHGAFISARYSTDNQNPDSIEVQVSKCSEWCQQHQIPILGVYADMAISGLVGLVRLRKMGLVMVSISTPWMRASSAAAQKPAQSRPDQL